MPTVKAIMAPMTIALDAIPVQRIAAVMMEIAAVAAISAAGAITHGISCVNHARVCMATPFQLPCNESLSNKSPMTEHDLGQHLRWYNQARVLINLFDFIQSSTYCENIHI